MRSVTHGVDDCVEDNEESGKVATDEPVDVARCACVKADAVPPNDNVVPATPTQLGTYRVQCTELCGLWHGNMADNTAMVVSTSDFATWIQQQTALDAPVMQYLPPYSHTYEPDPQIYGS